jgi:hypothetical protein
MRAEKEGWRARERDDGRSGTCAAAADCYASCVTRRSGGFICEEECGAKANTYPISRVNPRHYLGVFWLFGLLPRYRVRIRSLNTVTRQTHRNMVFGAGHSRISNTLSQIEHPNDALVFLSGVNFGNQMMYGKSGFTNSKPIVKISFVAYLNSLDK